MDIEKYISKETDSDITTLGIYQIIGGVIGLLFIIWGFVYNATAVTIPIMLVYILMVVFFSYSIFCGSLCIKTSKNALRCSLVNQVLQLVGFSIFGFAFSYIAGVYLSVKIDFINANFGLGFGVSTFDIKINTDEEIIKIDINVVALAIIFWIDRLMKQVKTDMEKRALTEIGTDLTL